MFLSLFRHNKTPKVFCLTFGVHVIGREEGKKEGVEIGREEGREETMVENARKLKELGVDIQIIVQAIGLDAETIAGL